MSDVSAASAAPLPALTIRVLSGPNLNLLGTREPHLYGTATLADVEAMVAREAAAIGDARVTVHCFQSNDEGALVTLVQEARDRADGLLVNFGGYSHTSVALRDALAAVADRAPAIEVHLSNVHAREPFRRRLLTAAACVGAVTGLGASGYPLALRALVERVLARRAPSPPRPQHPTPDERPHAAEDHS